MSYEHVASITQVGALLLFVAFFIGVLIYAFRPGNKKRFEEAARLLRFFGAEPRIFDPSDLPLPDQVKGDDHPAVRELRELSIWSEGQVWCSPERHGQISAVMKAQVDHLPLAMGGVRPTQGRTLAVMQVSGGSQSFNSVNTHRLLTLLRNQLRAKGA